jgi:hypothetical protein
MPGGTQLPGDPAADPTRADDSNPHAVLLSFIQ